MNIKRRLPHDPQGHSSALNDILFILLLFFLIISTLANPNVVKLSIPQSQERYQSQANGCSIYQ